MSTLLDPVIARLKAAGPAQWERIGVDAGVGKTLPRKLVYGDRTNPTVGSIQKLMDYFAVQDALAATAEPAQAGEVGHG